MTHQPAFISLKKLAVAAICLFISLVSFSQNGTDSTRHIVKVWKYNEESIEPAAKVVLERLKKTNPDATAQLTVEMLKPMVAQLTFEYKADNTYTVVTPQGENTGKWSLSDDKKTFKTISDMDGAETKRTITAINEKLFTIKTEDGVLLTMVPVK